MMKVGSTDDSSLSCLIPKTQLLSDRMMKMMTKVGATDEARFKYHLSNDETLKKLKTCAKYKDLEVLPPKNDDTIVVQLSTAAYMTTKPRLLEIWQGNEGEEFDKNDTAGLSIVPTEVERKPDVNNITVMWTVRLTVEGERVTLTWYDTKLKVMIQGNGMHVKYAHKVLVPHLSNEIEFNRKSIAQMNSEIAQLEGAKGTENKAGKAKNKANQPTRVSPRNAIEADIASLTSEKADPPSPQQAAVAKPGRMPAAAFFERSVLAIENIECEVCCENFADQLSLQTHVSTSHVPLPSKSLDLTASQKLIIPIQDMNDDDVDDDEDDDHDFLTEPRSDAAVVEQAQKELAAALEEHSGDPPPAATLSHLAMVHNNEAGDGELGNQVIVSPRQPRENFLVPHSPPPASPPVRQHKTTDSPKMRNSVIRDGRQLGKKVDNTDQIQLMGDENRTLTIMMERIIALEAKVKSLSEVAPCTHTCPQATSQPKSIPRPQPRPQPKTYASVTNKLSASLAAKHSGSQGGGAKEFKPAQRPKGKIDIQLFADSISRNVVGPAIEKSTGSLLRITRAYAAQEDQLAKFPNKTVNKVVRRHDRPVHTAILGAPSVDITNQQTGQWTHDEHATATVASSYSIIESAEYLVKSGKAKQVVVLEHCPRYDDADKARLAKLANQTLHTARNQSENAENILVGKHTGLVCEGEERRKRFTNDGTNSNSKHVRPGAYDQLHMYSQAGANAITASLLNILNQAGLVRDKKQTNRNDDFPPTTNPKEWQPPKQRHGFQLNQRNKDRMSGSSEIPTQNRFQVLW